MTQRNNSVPSRRRRRSRRFVARVGGPVLDLDNPVDALPSTTPPPAAAANENAARPTLATQLAPSPAPPDGSAVAMPTGGAMPSPRRTATLGAAWPRRHARGRCTGCGGRCAAPGRGAAAAAVTASSYPPPRGGQRGRRTAVDRGGGSAGR